MAVVQISKVQVRRGRKNSSSSIPQLSSGELGWAIDTQELFIGNGAVSEGAPYVGNTKILTEHDNILDLALQYQYKKNDATVITGPSSSQPVQRTVQQRLDDTVSVRSFGAVGDGVTDDTAAIQRAIDQLYLNDATKGSEASRVALNFEAGLYIISEPLRIPPYAVLKGAGKDKTIIEQSGEFSVAYTVADDSTPGSYTDVSTLTSLNQPRFIELHDMTLRHTLAGYRVLDLIATKNGHFSNVKFEGIWQAGDPLTENDYALHLYAKASSETTCQDNVFVNCDFVGMSYGVHSDYDISFNTWDNCLFSNLGRGIKFGDPSDNSTGKQFGPRKNKVTNSKFVDIDEEGFFINQGTGNLSSGNSYVRVGNDGGTSGTAAYAVIKFTDTGNVSTEDFFERSIDLTSNSSYLISSPYISEFEGSVNGNHKFNYTVNPITAAVSTPLFRLGGFNTLRYKVHYLYKSTSANIVRQGTLDIMLDKTNNQVSLTDEYDFVGSASDAEKLRFTASFDDLDAANGRETINIKYTNSTAGDTSTTSFLNYWYEVIS